MKIMPSPELNKLFALFLEHHPPRPLSAALRRMLLEYIYHRLKTGFHAEFGDLLWTLNDFLDLLDKAAGEA